MAGKKISELTALGATFGATDLFEISKASGGGFVSRKITGAEMTSSLPGTTYTAGDGLDLTGTVFSTDLKSNGGLVIESTELAVDLGASTITGTLAVGDGGTGASTLTDGGILLGSGTGAVTAMAALGDGVIVVGDGATDPVTITAFTASDGTLKHEIGGIETDISAITTGDILAGASAGTISIVAASGASDGDVLTIQADGTCDWEAGGGGGASVLNGLTDVKSTSDNSLWVMNAGAGNACVTGTLSTATDNLGIGTNALNAITSADYNIAIGLDAGTALTTSAANVMIGRGAGAKVSTGAGKNVMIGGYDTGGEITTQTDNVFIGYEAGSAAASGYNTCIGSQAGKGAMSAGYNAFLGYQSGMAATSAQQNVCVGYAAGFALTTGNFNVVVGRCEDITEGIGNTLIGVNYSTTSVTTGDYNVIVGHQAYAAATVNDQIAIGYQARSTAQYGIAIGNNIAAAGDRFVFGRASNTMTNDFTSDNSWTQSSDERKKKNIKDDSLGLSFINKLNTKTYQWKPAEEHPEEWKAWDEDDDGNKVYHKMDTETVMHGLIAQEVKETLDSEGCSTFAGWKEYEDGQQGISKEMFVFPLIKAVQQLSAKVAELEKQLNIKK